MGMAISQSSMHEGGGNDQNAKYISLDSNEIALNVASYSNIGSIIQYNIFKLTDENSRLIFFEKKQLVCSGTQTCCKGFYMPKLNQLHYLLDTC